MSAPLYAGVVHGIRIWRVVGTSDGPLLAGIVKDPAWPPGEPLRAACVADLESAEPHLAPGNDCPCGIYAYHPTGRFAALRIERALREPGRIVAGVIAASGRIEVHLDGFRAERAQVATLFIRTGSAEGPLIESLARAYGARIVRVEDSAAVREYASRLDAITSDAAYRLVVDGLEVELEPAVETFVGSSNEFVASSGYRFGDGPMVDASGWRLPGLSMFAVAGVSHRRAELQSPAFNPGRPVALVPEPDNPADRHAIAIYDAGRKLKVGYVPRSHRRVRMALRRDRIKRALVVWQYRGMNTGERSGIRVLTSPTDRVEIREPAEGAPYWGNNEDIPF